MIDTFGTLFTLRMIFRVLCGIRLGETRAVNHSSRVLQQDLSGSVVSPRSAACGRAKGTALHTFYVISSLHALESYYIYIYKRIDCEYYDGCDHTSTNAPDPIRTPQLSVLGRE